MTVFSQNIEYNVVDGPYIRSRNLDEYLSEIVILIDEHVGRHIGVDNDIVTITAITMLNVPGICLDGYNIGIERNLGTMFLIFNLFERSTQIFYTLAC